MKIAFLLTTSLDSPYGLGRCFPLARQMARLGHRVHLIALHHNLTPAVPRHFERDGVWVHYTGQMHVRKIADTTRYFSPLKLLWVVMAGLVGLSRQAMALKADVYHIGKPHPQNGLAGLLATRLVRKRRLFLDCDDYEAVANRFSRPWQQKGVAWLEDHLPLAVTGLTVNTSFLETRFRSLGVPADRILRLPNGVDHERFQAVTHDAIQSWRDRLHLDGQRVVIYVGSMSLVNHPVDYLLEAFAHLCARIPNAAMLLVGGGPDLVTLQRLADDIGIGGRCRFTGRVSGHEVPALLNLADVSVDPVCDDPVARARWPLKIMESLTVGVPVVTGDVGDRREMLGEETAGLLVSPGDPAALAEGLEVILANPSLRASLSAGCKLQASRYNLADLVTKLLTFYEQI